MEKYINLIFNFNTFIFILNVIIFIFSKQLLVYLDTSDLEWKKMSEKQLESLTKKREFLIIINFLIFFWYIISLFFDLSVINIFIKILAVILFAFIVAGFLIRWVVSIYWEKVEVNWETYTKRWYKTNIFSILSVVLVIIVTFYIIVDIAWFQEWLQSGGFIWGLLAFLWFTAPVWATDMFSSILLLHSWKVDLWDVVRFTKDWKYQIAFIKYINLSEVILIDLVYNTPIILRTSEFRNLEIINCSRNISWNKVNNLLQIIDAKIWYSTDLEQIKELFTYAIDLMLESIKDTEYEKYFPKDLKDEINVQIKDFGDYAVVYQLIYKISNPFYIIKANRLLNIYLQKAQKKYNIEFSTPDLFVETRI